MLVDVATSCSFAEHFELRSNKVLVYSTYTLIYYYLPEFKQSNSRKCKEAVCDAMSKFGIAFNVN